MVSYTTLKIQTNGERFYDITEEVKSELAKIVGDKTNGIIHLFITHTSCALTINESYDPSAKRDLERFLDHVAPRTLGFIEHTDEGEDDSPSHMKSMLLNQNMAFIVENSKLVLGTWQGIYLCEFRDSPKTRNILFKFVKD
jgi:secondary thiamine-phosphate synthase enzyme